MNTQVYPIEIQQGLSSQGSLVLIVADPKKGNMIPILIGYPEAQNIILALEHKETQRPMTHQLMLNTMGQYGLKLQQVVIERFLDGIFYANIYVSDGFNNKLIDSRASDAITLALLQGCPIYVTEEVMMETAVPATLIESNTNNSDPDIDELEKLLHKYEEEENFELADEVLKKIEALRNKKE